MTPEDSRGGEESKIEFGYFAAGLIPGTANLPIGIR